jgi:hypothetical protein
MVGKFEGLLDATVGTGAAVVGARVGAGEETVQTKPDPVKPFTRRNEKVRETDTTTNVMTGRLLPTHLRCICM